MAGTVDKGPRSLWTAEQVAAHLGFHVQTVYQKARAGELPSLKIGRALRFRPEEIESWLEAQVDGASA